MVNLATVFVGVHVHWEETSNYSRETVSSSAQWVVGKRLSPAHL